MNERASPHRERDQRLEQLAGIVEKQARTMARGLGWSWLEPLRQAGRLGALEAAGSFDPARGSLEAYAWPRIAGAMRDMLRDELPRMPPHLAAKVEQAVAALGAGLAYAAELARVDPDDLESRASGGGAAAGVGALLMGAPAGDPELVYSMKELVLRAVGELRERDRAVVRLHVLEGKTFEHCAAALGIHEKTARLRFHDAMRRLDTILRRLAAPA